MKQNPYTASKQWRLLITMLTVLALAALVYAVRKNILETIKNLGEVHAWALLLMLPLQFLNYHAYTKMYQAFFKFLRHPMDYRPMFRVNLELNFVNNIFPSGGVSGISYFGLRMRDYGVSPGKATLVQTLRLALLFASFQVLLFVGLFALALDGRVNGLTILIAGSLATFLFVCTLLLAFIIGSDKRINEFFTMVTRALNKLIHVVRRDTPETINIARVQRLFKDLHQNYLLIRGDMGLIKRAFLYALLANATEVLTVYVVYLAFGHWVNPGAVILAYAIANFAGLVSVLPGGVGIYEPLMTAVFITVGVPSALSIPVTVMYRILNMVIQLVPGGYFYHKTLRGNRIDYVPE